jgi:LuxR family maltose regulon positive regulatory protein
LTNVAAHENIERSLARDRWSLTEREIEIIDHAAKGLTADETGMLMFLSTPTVKWHRRNATGKLRARNLTHAVSLAHQLGII